MIDVKLKYEGGGGYVINTCENTKIYPMIFIQKHKIQKDKSCYIYVDF